MLWNGPLVAPAVDNVRDSALTKWSEGFDSQLVLGPIKVKEQHNRSLFLFYLLLSNSVTLCSQQGHQRL